MLIHRPQINIVSRVVTLATGELARAYFAVITSQGVQEVKFLGMKSLEAESAHAAPEAPVALLEKPCVSCYGESTAPAFKEQASPFFNAFDFLVNQLARAPSAA